jgi:hypothetical protein
MKSATELLEAYLDNVRTPKVSASQFAEDGVLELPWVKAHAGGPRRSKTYSRACSPRSQTSALRI